jgi:peptidoglycan/xylan/chitin deacetylase (PgdA/CDA1 family)
MRGIPTFKTSRLPWSAIQWRWRLKAMLASTISRAHDHRLASVLARGADRPLVLGYHRVVESFGATAHTEMPSMLVSSRMFERHLDCIGRQFTFVSLEEIGEHITGGRRFNKPVAAVTFDDGYRDVYEQAFPILKRKGIPAGVFVVTNLIGRPFWQVHDKLYHLMTKAFAAWRDPRREMTDLFHALDLPLACITRNRVAVVSPMLAVTSILPELPLVEVRRLMDGLEATVGNGFHNVPQTLGWAELAEMSKAGIEIGSHTKNHVSLPAEGADVVAEELAGSKKQLERYLGKPVRHFAYPGGQFTPAVVEAVKRADYEFAYTACRHGDRSHPALTIERLLLWQGSSVDADGRFSPAILNCQVQDLWPPARRCGRAHAEMDHPHG